KSKERAQKPDVHSTRGKPKDGKSKPSDAKRHHPRGQDRARGQRRRTTEEDGPAPQRGGGGGHAGSSLGSRRWYYAVCVSLHELRAARDRGKGRAPAPGGFRAHAASLSPRSPKSPRSGHNAGYRH